MHICTYVESKKEREVKTIKMSVKKLLKRYANCLSRFAIQLLLRKKFIYFK